jgi:hypothetical protein
LGVFVDKTDMSDNRKTRRFRDNALGTDPDRQAQEKRRNETYLANTKSPPTEAQLAKQDRQKQIEGIDNIGENLTKINKRAKRANMIAKQSLKIAKSTSVDMQATIDKLRQDLIIANQQSDKIAQGANCRATWAMLIALLAALIASGVLFK